MRRREFIAMLGGTALAPCVTAEAQQETRVWRIGYLTGTSRAATGPYNFGAFVEGLRELGYLEGKNITIDLRLAEGRTERMPELAREDGELHAAQVQDDDVAVNRLRIAPRDVKTMYSPLRAVAHPSEGPAGTSPIDNSSGFK